VHQALIIDFHHHLLNLEHYVDGLIGTMDELGIDKVCLSGLGLASDNWLGDLSPDNEDVLRAIERHPDRVVGFGTIRLGDDPPERIGELHAAGFRGIKTTRPRFDYDDRRFDEHYALAQQLQLPILFHTGFIVGVNADPRDDVSSARCRPVLLDRVARTFPELTIVMAHLGMPWYEEAAQMCRFHPNVYADLSGSPMGWRNRKSPAFFAELFYWENAFEKILFGSDVSWHDLPASLADHRRLTAALNLGEETQAKIFGGTARHILRIS
jgi:predicted TIM-barrel fold metal-dependent hydrolase